MENSEIDRQLGELWKKASGKDYVPGPSESPRFAGSEIDTVRFLKNNFSKAESDWKRLLEVKEANIRELTSQLAEVRAQLGELRRYYQDERESVIGEELDAALSLGEAGKAIEAQKSAHARETASLNEELERMRLEKAALTERVNVVGAERDSWRKKFIESSVERSALKDAAAALERKLAAAEEAAERTFAELKAERLGRAEASKKALESEKKAADLESRLFCAKADWDAERAGWRELLDRMDKLSAKHPGPPSGRLAEAQPPAN